MPVTENRCNCSLLMAAKTVLQLETVFMVITAFFMVYINLLSLH